jgi:hypothetical protein
MDITREIVQVAFKQRISLGDVSERSGLFLPFFHLKIKIFSTIGGRMSCISVGEDLGKNHQNHGCYKGASMR